MLYMADRSVATNVIVRAQELVYELMRVSMMVSLE